MKALTHQLLSLFAAPVLAGLLGAYAPFTSAAEPLKEIRIAVPDVGAGQNHSGGGIVDVLHTRKLLEKEFANDGIEIKWTYFKGAGPVINEAFANGQVDFAYLGDLAAIIGKASGLDTRLLAATGRGVNHYLGVQPGSGIKTLADLKGKRVGIFRGTASQLSFDNALASVGLGEKDLKVISLDFNAALAALAARQIDATWGLAGLFALREKGLAEIPLSTRDLGGAGTLQAVLVGNGAFVDAHPEITQRLLKVELQALAWAGAEANHAAFIDLVSNQAGYPPIILQTEYKDRPLADALSPQLDAGFLGQLDASIQAAKQYGLIRRDFKAADWAKPDYLAAAARLAAAQPVAQVQ
ncbi:sulfonate transport system substrate-binding protein [Pseudomonas delhiensis]|uniref:Sulfonate transport system substrate-binding protein n=1 Tax=Pseudomonas delhiensis TaxID=366289 RepID=A0A239LSK0_9PSED|nr:ABC transporter substrate-binding protein [Pseudomonas delhiensis]SDJ95043.1 sulfonate transport system substrate-binding protein [Pseudomonas delhiensis]SNT33421.1 sulfonate transport system substrate-binding protein [Pseudomonas delhiensis]